MQSKCRVLQSGDANITQTFHRANTTDRHGRYWDYYHGGIDLVRNPHYLDWIVAHTAGTVVGIRVNCTGFEGGGSYGNYVLLKHKNGYYTMYAHLAFGTQKVKLGDKVKKGQVLAYMDNTGTSYGGHLHWEVRNKEGGRIDPEPYLNADLPGMNKKSVTARGYDATKKAWLPKVKNKTLATTTQIIGNPYHRLGAVTIKVANIKNFEGYNVWTNGKKTFGKKITEYGVHKGEYAGSKLRGAVAVAIDCPSVAFKVKIKKTQKWLPTVYGKHYNLKDPVKGDAGNGKDIIDEIIIWIV